ncbi:MAG: C1 family peptidase, partial [Candidatus Altiarchaeota archaeon]
MSFISGHLPVGGKGSPIIVLFICFLALLVIVGMLFFNTATPTGAAVAASYKVEFASEPQGAYVSVDKLQNRITQTPDAWYLTPGEHKIFFYKAGYVTYETTVNVAGSGTKVTATLTPFQTTTTSTTIRTTTSTTTSTTIQSSTTMTTLDGYSKSDITPDGLDGEGISQALKTDILRLSTDRRMELKAKLEGFRKKIREKGVKWTAGYTSKSILSEEEQKRLCGVLGLQAVQEMQTLKSTSSMSSVSSVNSPISFDWRNRHGQNYVSPVRDQGQCGSCWAFASLGAFEGSITSYYNQPALIKDLSEQEIISCFYKMGCCGATASKVEELFSTHFVNNGTPSEQCFPYQACDSSHQYCFASFKDGDICADMIDCSTKCSDWPQNAWKTRSYVKVGLNRESLKQAIGYYGPIEVFMIVYEDFLAYTGGIYSHTSLFQKGGHAVTLVGWGRENGVEYWISKNSWGTSWGENGFFRIAMGDSGIDSMAALAVVEPIPSTGTPPQRMCFNNDNDEFCNWGAGPKPATCPTNCGDIQDFDDRVFGTYEICENQVDDDSDGQIDCADSADCPESTFCDSAHIKACNSVGACMPFENCETTGDEDGDGLADCMDATNCPKGTFCNQAHTLLCNPARVCKPPENCETVGDEDGNGQADCADSAACQDGAICNQAHTRVCAGGNCIAAEICSAQGDEDGDGLADCMDQQDCNGRICDAQQKKTCINQDCKVTGLPVMTYPWYPGHLDISDNKLVFELYVQSASQIFVYDVSGNSTLQITSSEIDQKMPRISANRIVWQTYPKASLNVPNRVVSYDLQTGAQSTLTLTDFYPFYPDVDGDIVVYSDDRTIAFPGTDTDPNSDIYRYDFSTSQERQITTNPQAQEKPTLSGSKVVYTDLRDGYDIYLFDTATGIEQRLTTSSADQFDPQIDGKHIVWVEGVISSIYDPWSIYLYDIDTSQTRRISSGSRSHSARVSGNKVAWLQASSSGAYDLFLYDIPTGQTTQLTAGALKISSNPAIDRRHLMWASGQTLYLYSLPQQTQNEDCTTTGDEDGDGLADCSDTVDCPAGAFCNSAHTKLCNAQGACVDGTATTTTTTTTTTSTTTTLSGGCSGSPAYQITDTDYCSDQYGSGYTCDQVSNGNTYDYWFGQGTGTPKWTYGDLGSVKCVSAVRAWVYSGYV